MLQTLLRSSWSFRGSGIRPFSQVRNSSFEVCGWLWVSWVAQVPVVGGCLPKAGPAIAGLPPPQGEVSAFLMVLFPPGLLRSVAQTYRFPWVRSNAPFLVGQGDCIVSLLLHQLRLLDTLRLFSPALQSPWLSFSYWWRATERMNGMSINTLQAGGRAAQLMCGCWRTLPSP